MASSVIRASTCLCSLSSTTTKPIIFNNLSSSRFSSSSSVSLNPKTARLQLCLGPFSPWSGLKHLGVSVTWRSLKFEKKKCKDRVAYASLFGVGAPEALVIGVVALLVFGPKGLAEVARSLGKTLRAFQPTIRELQEVSREFKSTLEKEIGLDEISSSTPEVDKTTNPPPSLKSIFSNQMAADPNGSSSQNNAYTSEEYLKVTEEQLKAAAAQQQGQTPSQSVSQLEAQTISQDSVSSAGGAYTTEVNLETGDQQPKAASSQDQEQGQKSSPAATVKETAS
ncbi:sec-independent protein translocase protein TATB, chloroplastic [Morus notabilis]|uniref:sec-independent protein translocase protein TATB, chloroplastic n=1 Tax=Morus notabilis TaxID=981085 RepID=UPI000CED6CC3|nr:sec-independent protein translocase protein TATB, chloroplastic [Morus notabilis]